MNVPLDPKDIDVVRQLEALADTPMPPTAVSITRALADGRRNRRNRALTTGALSVTAALLIAGAGVFAATSRTHATPVQIGAAGSAASCAGSVSALPMPTSTEVPVTGTDPFGVGAKFGWLPDVDTHVGVINGPLGALDSVARGATSATNAPFFWLQTLPCMSEQQAFTFIKAGGKGSQSPVAPINGKSAFSLSVGIGQQAGSASLLWQMSNGKWAYLYGYYLNSDAAAEVRHVAETVTPETSPPALPLRISGLPKQGLSIDYYAFDQPALDSDAAFDFSVGLDLNGQAVISYIVGPAASVKSGGGDACKSANGLKVCVSAPSGVPSSIHGGLQALLGGVTLMSVNPSTWTTNVLDLN